MRIANSAALGVSQIAAGLCQGFAVSGTESRTAMNHAMGGKSQVAGLVAAAAMAAVLLFLTGPLSYLPKAALGAVLIFAAIGLFDVASLRRLWQREPTGVRRGRRDHDGRHRAGRVGGDPDGGRPGPAAAPETQRPPARRRLGPRAGHERIPRPCPPCRRQRTPGLLLYRFGAGIVFYNASYFKKRVLELAAAQPDLKWLVIDGSTINTIDSTGAETVEALARDLARQGIRLGLAGFRTETRSMLQRAGAMAAIGTDSVYPTLKSAMNAFLAVRPSPPVGGPEAGDSPAKAPAKEPQNE